jgi:hypothetical protein
MVLYYLEGIYQLHVQGMYTPNMYIVLYLTQYVHSIAVTLYAMSTRMHGCQQVHYDVCILFS